MRNVLCEKKGLYEKITNNINGFQILKTILQCRFENLLISSCSYENVMLKIHIKTPFTF